MKPTSMFQNSRYNALPRLYDDKQGFMVMPAVPEFSSYYTHIVHSYDTVDGLARKYYGDSKHQWAILVANEIPFPFTLRLGMKLMIPDKDEVYAFIEGGSL